METLQAIAERYSHKVAFDPDRAVPDEDLLTIAKAGAAAPSAGNGQSPEFIIINDSAISRKIGDITGHVVMQTAPAMVAILTKPRVRQVLDISTECLICDFAVAAQNMLLAATALGYRCGWLDGPFTDADIQKQCCQLLEIPEDRMLLMMVPVGYEGEPGVRREKKPIAQRASWNRYAVER